MMCTKPAEESKEKKIWGRLTSFDAGEEAGEAIIGKNGEEGAEDSVVPKGVLLRHGRILRKDGVPGMGEDTCNDGGGEGRDEGCRFVNISKDGVREEGEEDRVDHFAAEIKGDLLSHGIRNLLREHRREGPERG